MQTAESKLIFWLTTFLAGVLQKILTTLFLNSALLSPTVSHNIMLLCAYSEYDHKIVELGDRVPVSILSLLRIRSNMCRPPVSEGGRVEL